MEMARFSSRAFLDALDKSGGLILPTASTELTGLHAPLGTDTIVAENALPRISEKLGMPYAPVIPYGDTLELPPGEGTVHIPAHVLEEMYYAAACSFFKCRELRRLFFLNFHSLNNRAADSVCRRLRAEGRKAFLIDWWKTVSLAAGDILEDTRYGTGHGSEMITSVLLALAPGSVDMSLASSAEPKPAFAFYAKHLWNSGSPFLAYGNFSDYAGESVWGGVPKANAEKGEKLVARALDAIAGFVSSCE